ncbi:short coiled-coil protein [Geosmithia morbida]|uniref:Short coiled-coil protein n=1 Tax=Geosmithia morbida TaxID=1094350 RepID=A0A9P4Z1S6_9HYPO|nr:short coiled-coil protein [Geosmithia morbida]KAF4127020.1 short coiled-coil protein [Geosmithia morbida]
MAETQDATVSPAPATLEPQPTPVQPTPAPVLERSNSSLSTAATSEANEVVIHQPIPQRPRLPSRKSSGPLVVPRDSSAVGPIEPHFGPDDVRAMSPRRTSEDIDKMGKEARKELRKHAQALQESLLTIFNRIEAVREEHDKLDSNNKFLQKYIGDLMSTSKITAPPSKGKK